MWTFWIDRGGTFTDIVATAPDGRVQVAKTPSRSSAGDDPVVTVMRTLMSVADGEPFPSDRVAAIRIGTTVATNALLERKGARTVTRYMGWVQDTAEACVRRAIGGLTNGMARVPMAGGGAGKTGRQSLIAADGGVRELPGCFAIEVAAGESIEIRTPGGGGFGPPPRP